MENTFEITENIFLQITEFQGQKRIDIRKWFKDKENEWQRTRKGINLSVDEWTEFLENFEAMVDFIEDKIQ